MVGPMTFKTLTTLLYLASFTTLARADESRFEKEKTDKRIVKSFDESASLTVKLEYLDRSKILRIDKGKDKAPEVWLGKRRLPTDILWLRPTMINSFCLTIDGKKIHVPERFWNDITGLHLEKMIVNKKISSDNDKIELWRYSTQQCAGPVITRSANRGTVLISWARPEE